jgi:hypothetical protein
MAFKGGKKPGGELATDEPGETSVAQDAQQEGEGHRERQKK